MSEQRPKSEDMEKRGSEPGRPVQHCPFCGESIGYFWGRREDDGASWCEACQLFFRVEVE